MVPCSATLASTPVLERLAQKEENAADLQWYKHDKGNGKKMLIQLSGDFLAVNSTAMTSNANKVGSRQSENNQWNGNGNSAENPDPDSVQQGFHLHCRRASTQAWQWRLERAARINNLSSGVRKKLIRFHNSPRLVRRVEHVRQTRVWT